MAFCLVLLSSRAKARVPIHNTISMIIIYKIYGYQCRFGYQN